MREGYSVDDVDAVVDRVMTDLASEGPPAIAGEEIQRLRFTPVRMGTGYDMGEVDTWLDEVVAELERRRTGGAAPAPSVDTLGTAPLPPTVEPAPGAIEEVGRGIDPVMTALAVIAVLLLALVVLYVA